MAGKFWFERSGHHSIQTNNCTTIVQLTRNRFSSHFTYVRLKTSTSLQGKQQSQQYKNSRENFYCFKNVYLQRNSNLIKFYWNFFFGYSNGKCFPTKEKNSYDFSIERNPAFFPYVILLFLIWWTLVTNFTMLTIYPWLIPPRSQHPNAMHIGRKKG